MFDEPGPDAIKESETEPPLVAGSDRQHAPSARQPQPWGRDDRNRLLLWVVIAFALPVPFALLLHLWIKPIGSVFTIQSELPTKAIIAFFVVLATWFVSRKEKRPLDDYGIPPRQAFGKGSGKVLSGASLRFPPCCWFSARRVTSKLIPWLSPEPRLSVTLSVGPPYSLQYP